MGSPPNSTERGPQSGDEPVHRWVVGEAGISAGGKDKATFFLFISFPPLFPFFEKGEKGKIRSDGNFPRESSSPLPHTSSFRIFQDLTHDQGEEEDEAPFPLFPSLNRVAEGKERGQGFFLQNMDKRVLYFFSN